MTAEEQERKQQDGFFSQQATAPQHPPRPRFLLLLHPLESSSARTATSWLDRRGSEQQAVHALLIVVPRRYGRVPLPRDALLAISSRVRS